MGGISNEGSADLRRERDDGRLLAELETAGMDVCRDRRSKGRRDGGAEEESAVGEEARAAGGTGAGIVCGEGESGGLAARKMAIVL